MTTVATGELSAPERAPGAIPIDWPLIVTIAGAILMITAAVASAPAPQLAPYLSEGTWRAVSGVAFSVAIIMPVIFCWRRAIRDNQLPAKRGLEPQYEHVNGWNAVFLLAVVLLIGAVVWWASQGDEENQTIHSEWGKLVVLGLTAAFVVIAAAPIVPKAIRFLRLEQPATAISRMLNAPVDTVGRSLSVIDSMLVFAIANSAGTNRKNFVLRYGLLLSVIGPCAVLGYYWQPPVAFVPIGWGFLVAFAVSRRWAWIEQDRELAMLNSTISQAHIRVGFSQNLRDEALIAFLSIFLIVPLALRQAQLLALEQNIELFTVSPADIDSVPAWIAFYGTELAKAVPFVDWAEIYHVEGAASIKAESDYAQHAVFLTRVLIDLVFLAALLQAVSSASRDAQQRDLFYKKQSIHRLDPFTEPEAFRILVRKGADDRWQVDPTTFDDFPRQYDPNRLVELTTSSDERVAAAATFLRERDGAGDDPHYQLSTASAERDVTPERISALLDTIENTGPARNPYQLALARRRVLGRRDMRPVRARLVTMIAQSNPPSFERTDRLIEAMVGETREGYAQERGIALEALAPAVATNFRVEAAVRQVAEHDTSKTLQARAREILDAHHRTA
jgi:hypothetical protein